MNKQETSNTKRIKQIEAKMLRKRLTGYAFDFHVHAKVSSHKPFNAEEFENKISKAKAEQIDCFAVTEHAHASNWEEAYKFLESNYEFVGDYYETASGVKIFTGVEITTKEGFDIVCIGQRNMVFELVDAVRKNIAQSNEKHIAIGELSKNLDSSMLVILAHPYRRGEDFSALTDEVLEKFDAIEFNANEIDKKGIDEISRVNELSKKLGNIPIVGGSDTHNYVRMGLIANKFKTSPKTIAEIKLQIRQKNFEVEFSPVILNIL